MAISAVLIDHLHFLVLNRWRLAPFEFASSMTAQFASLTDDSSKSAGSKDCVEYTLPYSEFSSSASDLSDV